MYHKIISQKHTFKHNTNSKLVSGIPISSHRVLLFFSNGRYFQYDLCQSKILNSLVTQNLIKLSLLSQSQLLVLTQTRKLACLDIQKNILTDICKLPKFVTGDELRDRNTFHSTQIYPFVKSNSFCIKQIAEQENKIRVVYFTQKWELCQIKQFSTINVIIEPINQYSLIAMYKQCIQKDKNWEIRIFDLSNSFQERKYIVERQGLYGTGTVVRTYMKSQNQLLIFINGQNPEILILNLERGDIREMNYKLQPNFIDIGFYNREKSTMGLIFLAYSEANGKTYQNLIQLVDIETGRLFEKQYLTIGDPLISCDNKFILDCQYDSPSGNISSFYTRHLLERKSLYFHILHKSQILENYGQKLCYDVIRILDQNQ